MSHCPDRAFAPVALHQISIRRGKWSTEEEAYANRLIQEFKLGHIPGLPSGITLRSFLSQMLNCDPMRISKRFAGKKSMGKDSYRKHKQKWEEITDIVECSRRELEQLENDFLKSISMVKSSHSVISQVFKGDFVFHSEVSPIPLYLQPLLSPCQTVAENCDQMDAEQFWSMCDSIQSEQHSENHWPLRRGKWSAEEEAYANRLIQEFKQGLIPGLPPKTTLRTFLSELLNCDPMRISKKFAGDKCVGKSYHKRKQNWEEVADQVDKTKRELEELERQYLEQLAKSSKNSTLGGRTETETVSMSSAQPCTGLQDWSLARQNSLEVIFSLNGKSDDQDDEDNNNSRCGLGDAGEYKRRRTASFAQLRVDRDTLWARNLSSSNLATDVEPMWFCDPTDASSSTSCSSGADEADEDMHSRLSTILSTLPKCDSLGSFTDIEQDIFDFVCLSRSASTLSLAL